MARHAGGRPPQRPIKGFRPGKEPPQLRKQRARQQFGEMNAAQERLVDLFADRSPDQSRVLLRRWRIGLLIGAIVLAVLGAVLYAWSIVAGAVIHALAVAVLVLWWRLHRQRTALEAMADAVSGERRGRRRK